MSRHSSLFLTLFMCSVVTAMAVPADSTAPEEDNQGPRRKASWEFYLGMQFNTKFAKQDYYDEFGIRRTTDTTFTQNLFCVGWGGHVPLVKLGKLSTLWFVPAAIIKGGLHNTGSSGTGSSGSPDVSMELSVPVYITAGIGGLQRRSYAWGVEGGIGANMVANIRGGTSYVVPSALLDLIYAPRISYRLRFMADLATSSITPTSDPSYTQRTWSIGFVVGW